MSSQRRIHIVSFDNPWPPDYGGAVDVFYRIRSLAAENIDITLHAFTYGRELPGELAGYCSNIIFYKRTRWVNPVSSKPYIVASRESSELLHNLLTDEAPILFEGLHTCSLLNHPSLAGRIRLVRMHNIEHRYYRSLAENESDTLRRLWFRHEAARLKTYSVVLKHASVILAISPPEGEWLTQLNQNTFVVRPFHPSEMATGVPGCGSFALYHGKLSVSENDRAARFIAAEIASGARIPVVIAGENPGRDLRKIVGKSRNVSLVANPSPSKIEDLIRGAQINLLPAFQETGIKLKLINALFMGRHVIANRKMVNGTGCETLCHIAGTAEEFTGQINRLCKEEFSAAMLRERSEILNKLYNNKKNAAVIIKKAGY